MYQSQRVYALEVSMSAMLAKASPYNSQLVSSPHVEERINYVPPQVKYIEIPKMHFVEVTKFISEKIEEVPSLRSVDNNVKVLTERFAGYLKLNQQVPLVERVMPASGHGS